MVEGEGVAGPADVCRAGDCEVRLTWWHGGAGLTGELVVRNTGTGPCVIGGKPSLQPLGQDGAPLDVRHIVSLEGRHDGVVLLQPADRARAPVWWAGWDGPPASGRWRVEWNSYDGSTDAEVQAEGPLQPGPPVHGATNTSSSWFERAS